MAAGLLMGLHKEGILSGSQVSSFRSHFLDVIIASTSPLHQGRTPILRDKLLFLKVLGNRVRKKLSQIQSATSSSIQFTNEDIEAVSTKLPVDMADLNRLFSKHWCEKCGNAVVDVVRREFEDHVWEMSSAKEGRRRTADENSHPKNQQPQRLQNH